MLKAVDIYNGTHERGVDFFRVKAAGYDMAIVKATEGVSYTDPSFTTNVDGARAARMLVGAYHLMRATPIEQ
jgi:lysozyme